MLHRSRTLLSWSIFIIALIIMIIPLPSNDDTHLMSISEANDETLVILTTASPDYLIPLIDSFQAQNPAIIHIVPINTNDLNSATIQQTNADLILAHDISVLVPLLKADLIDTLPPDLMWSVNSVFRDPNNRWIGYSGQINGDILTISAIAIAQSANSKPLAQLFLSLSYLPQTQLHLAESTGLLSLSAYVADTAMLETLEFVDFAVQFDSDAIIDRQNRPNQVASTH